MTTLNKLITREMDEMTIGELRQSLMQTSIQLNDYITPISPTKLFFCRHFVDTKQSQ